MIKQGLKLNNSRYVLKDRLGQGSFGEVWTATDIILDELVAVKFVSQLRECLRGIFPLKIGLSI